MENMVTVKEKGMGRAGKPGLKNRKGLVANRANAKNILAPFARLHAAEQKHFMSLDVPKIPLKELIGKLMKRAKEEGIDLSGEIKGVEGCLMVTLVDLRKEVYSIERILHEERPLLRELLGTEDAAKLHVGMCFALPNLKEDITNASGEIRRAKRIANGGM